MSKWNDRSPDAFPYGFSLAVDRAMAQLKHMPEGSEATAIILQGIESQHKARRHADKFRWWRKCLRTHPLHRLHHTENEFTLRTIVRPERAGDGQPSWTLGLVLRKREDLAEELKHILEQ